MIPPFNKYLLRAMADSACYSPLLETEPLFKLRTQPPGIDYISLACVVMRRKVSGSGV